MKCVRLTKVSRLSSFRPFLIILRRISRVKAVEKAIHNKDSIKGKDAVYGSYLAAVDGKSNNEAREIAADILGEPVFWDCDRKSLANQHVRLLNYLLVPRTREGYYHYTGGIEVGMEV